MADSQRIMKYSRVRVCVGLINTYVQWKWEKQILHTVLIGSWHNHDYTAPISHFTLPPSSLQSVCSSCLYHLDGRGTWKLWERRLFHLCLFILLSEEMWTAAVWEFTTTSAQVKGSRDFPNSKLLQADCQMKQLSGGCHVSKCLVPKV